MSHGTDSRKAGRRDPCSGQHGLVKSTKIRTLLDWSLRFRRCRQEACAWPVRGSCTAAWSSASSRGGAPAPRGSWCPPRQLLPGAAAAAAPPLLPPSAPTRWRRWSCSRSRETPASDLQQNCSQNIAHMTQNFVNIFQNTKCIVCEMFHWLLPPALGFLVTFAFFFGGSAVFIV